MGQKAEKAACTIREFQQKMHTQRYDHTPFWDTDGIATQLGPLIDECTEICMGRCGLEDLPQGISEDAVLKSTSREVYLGAKTQALTLLATYNSVGAEDSRHPAINRRTTGHSEQVSCPRYEQN